MNLYEQIEQVTKRFDFHKNDLEILQNRKIGIESDIEQLNEDQVLLKKSDAVLEEVIKSLNDSSISMVEDLVGRGLTAIFEQYFQFKIKISTKRGNLNYDMYLLEDGKECDIMNSYGGGIVDIISILMRIVTILVVTPPLKRILILDESLKHLSRDYIDNAAEFLRNLGKDLGFTIIMVSHDHTFMDHADKIIEVQKFDDYSEVKG